jgi:acetyltransferase-like isoleucine patch superfamily enzyme
MGKGLSFYIKKSMGMRPEMSLSFYAIDFIFRRILRQNAGVKWAVHHTATIHCPEKIKKGIGTYPGDSPGVYINAQNGVVIGDYTNLGPNVGIISANHDYINNESYSNNTSINIGKHCWLGKDVNIMPGVVLGDFTIVGAGAIVTKSFTDGYCVLAGNPATVIKQLNKTDCEAFAQSK